MQSLVENFPSSLVIIPGRYKFPNQTGWQKKRSTAKRGWSGAKQLMCLCGKVSGVTVIDIDGDFDFWLGLSEKYEIPETTCVQTPSGGFHLYFQYCEYVKTTTKMWGNKGGKGSLDIDIRNDRSVAALPGSIYEIHPRDREKKAHKLEHVGKTYEFFKTPEGKVLDFSVLAPMPLVIR